MLTRIDYWLGTTNDKFVSFLTQISNQVDAWRGRSATALFGLLVVDLVIDRLDRW